VNRPLLGAAAINGREPRVIIPVTVREAFLHCGNALKRARLWHDDYRLDRRSFPSLGRMIVEQTKPAAVTVEQADAFVEENYVTGLYLTCGRGPSRAVLRLKPPVRPSWRSPERSAAPGVPRRTRRVTLRFPVYGGEALAVPGP
jgi:hypothetical protein